MRKRSKVSKKNFKINRNFFIFHGIILLILLYITRGDWIKFIVFSILEMIAYFAFIRYFLGKQSRKKCEKKSIYSGEKYTKEKNYTPEVFEIDESRGTRRASRKNYNWEISMHNPRSETVNSSDNTQNTRNENLESSNFVNSERKSINGFDTSVDGVENRKISPYWSPFQYFRQQAEEQKAKEQKEEEKKVEEQKAEQKEEQWTDGQKVEEQQVDEPKEETNKASELVKVNFADAEDIKVELKECMDVCTPEPQIVGSKQADILTPQLENEESSYGSGSCNQSIVPAAIDRGATSSQEVVEKTNAIGIMLYDDSEGNEDTDFVETEEVSREVESSSVLNPQVLNDSKSAQLRKMPLDMAEYKPPIELLRKNEVSNYDEEADAFIEYNSYKLIDTLASFGVGARVLNVSKGPTVTRYELQPNAGVKVSKIINLADDIALNLAATGVRIEAPIPGKAAIGIEIPNKNNVPVFLRDVIDEQAFQNHPSKLAFAVGKDIAGNVVVGDIAKMPHLLIAGATGSGKSVCINTLIVSILYKASPAEVRLLMVDPKVVELGIYNGIPHLLIPVVTEPKKAAGALTWAVTEMTTRYRLFAESNVRDLKGYNELIKERGEGEPLPHIVIIIDELADLMMVAPNEVEDSICRLAQMARAAGMHLVIATQRPSVNVITGVIKANVPSRISFAVSSQIDSRTILDMAGAEKLLGRGDMLFYPLGQPKPLRVQGSFITDKEVENIVTHIKSLQSAEYDEEILQKIDNQTETPKPDSSGDDELLPQAIATVLELGQASASLIQRKFKVGYSRAARILDQMESWGVVSPSDGSSKPRQILITKQEWEELNT